MVRIVSALLAGVAPLILTSCGASSSAPPSATTVVASSATALPSTVAPSPGEPCHLAPVRDLIEWHQFRHPPSVDGSTGQPPSAVRVGNVNLVGCKSLLDGWVADHSVSAAEIAAGFRACSEIAWADDNPGYDVHAIPAPRLKNVLLQAGNDC